MTKLSHNTKIPTIENLVRWISIFPYVDLKHRIDRSYLDDFSKDANKIGGLDDATKENEQQSKRKRRDSVVAAESNEALEMKLKKPIVMESIALMHSLDCELLELPVSKRLKINHKYVQLFGPNHSVNYYDVTDEQKFHACRKRIAHLVVTHLTKYYEQHRIANRSIARKNRE